MLECIVDWYNLSNAFQLEGDSCAYQAIRFYLAILSAGRGRYKVDLQYKLIPGICFAINFQQPYSVDGANVGHK